MRINNFVLLILILVTFVGCASVNSELIPAVTTDVTSEQKVVPELHEPLPALVMAGEEEVAEELVPLFVPENSEQLFVLNTTDVVHAVYTRPHMDEHDALTVERGDTLSGLCATRGAQGAFVSRCVAGAYRHGGAVIEDPNLIYAGEEIFLPKMVSNNKTAMVERHSPTHADANKNTRDVEQGAVPIISTTPSDPDGGEHATTEESLVVTQEELMLLAEQEADLAGKEIRARNEELAQKDQEIKELKRRYGVQATFLDAAQERIEKLERGPSKWVLWLHIDLLIIGAAAWTHFLLKRERHARNLALSWREEADKYRERAGQVEFALGKTIQDNEEDIQSLRKELAKYSRCFVFEETGAEDSLPIIPGRVAEGKPVVMMPACGKSVPFPKVLGHVTGSRPCGECRERYGFAKGKASEGRASIRAVQ